MKNRTTTNPNRVRDNVPTNVLDPRFDRFSFGVTIINSLVTFLRNQPDSISRTFPVGRLRALQLVALRCSDGSPDALRILDDQSRIATPKLFCKETASALKYEDSQSLASNLSNVSTGFKNYALEEEITAAGSEIVCLPPRSFAPFNKRVQNAFDSTPVRRLANVSQLALCYHVYPGASFTRKEHTLGTFEVVTRLLRHVLLDKQNPTASLILTSKHQRLALLGALLHDIAHIPLMHEFEDAVPELKQEKYISEILDKKWGDTSFQQAIDDVLAEWDVNRHDLKVILGAKEFCDSKPEGIEADRFENLWQRIDYQLVRSLLDGAIDADKIDYIQRDALHAGVQYGHGVDLERLERTMTVALWLESDKKGNLNPKSRFGAWSKGQVAAEAVISARHSMYSQVYAHRTIRAARAMLNYVAWNWQEAECYAGWEPNDLADRLFEFAAMLQKRRKEGELFERNEPSVQSLGPQLADNLPFSDARVIRWMAAISGSGSVKHVAEALIERRLYKELCVLADDEVRDFLNRAYPLEGRSKWLRKQTVWGAQQWLALITSLNNSVASFIAERRGSFSRVLTTPDAPEVPMVLMDIAIPKTMRTQKELAIVTDHLGHQIGWKRLEQRMHVDQPGCISGTSVKSSPVYEVFGGNVSGEPLSKITVRLFARSDLADSLRPHLEASTIRNWFNAFRP